MDMEGAPQATSFPTLLQIKSRAHDGCGSNGNPRRTQCRAIASLHRCAPYPMYAWLPRITRNALISAARFGSGFVVLPGVTPKSSGAVDHGLVSLHARRTVDAQVLGFNMSGLAFALSWPANQV